MWVVGDSLLNSTVPNLMRWKNDTGKHHYINKCYEITPYTVTDTNNFLIQIQKGLARAINANNFLPDILLIVLGNTIPGERILFLKHEFYIQKIMQMIKESIFRRCDQLPRKARSVFNTKILITKALPRPEDQDFKLRRRKYNKQLDIEGKLYNIETIQINDIIPSDQTMFEGPDLSDIGKRKMWAVISDKIKTLDTSDAEALEKRRNERRSGEIDSNSNTWLYLNTRQRRNNNREYLGVEIQGANQNQHQQRPHHIDIQQRRHRALANNFNQMRRQALIQQHIDRRNQRGGRNGAAEWYSVMSFVNNMERNQGEIMGDFHNRMNDAYNRRVNRMFQSGDGMHMDLYNNHQRRRQNQNN